MMEHFHFLRPVWLLAIPLWLGLLALLYTFRASSNRWASICDPDLLNFLVDKLPEPKRLWPLWGAMSVAGILSLLALAGPAYQQLPQPVMQVKSGMVVVLDLSRSMLAEDVKPNRLQRAKMKIRDILALRHEGQTGLVVFAGDAFDVVPMTTDTQAILSLLDSLEPAMMPMQGSQASTGLSHADALLKRAGLTRGDIIMLTDGVDVEATDVVRRWQSRTLSVIAVGSEEGAPIPSEQGRFLHDQQGNIVMAGVDMSRLQGLANAGNGVFRTLKADDRDILGLPGLQNSLPDAGDESLEQREVQTDQWREEGPWLLLLALPLLALMFRRGLLLSLLIVVMLGSNAESAQAWEWRDLWQTPDQQAQKLMEKNQPDQAAQRFEDERWKAAATYKAGDYDAAAKLWNEQLSVVDQEVDPAQKAQMQYNRGNALARAHRYEEAIGAYEQALKLQPEMSDAMDNLELVKKLLEQQQQNSDQSKQDDGKQGDSQQNDGQQGQQDQSQQGQGEQSKDQQGQSQQDQGQNQPANSQQQNSQGSQGSDSQQQNGQSGQSSEQERNDQSAMQNKAGEQSDPQEQQNQQLSQSDQKQGDQEKDDAQAMTQGKDGENDQPEDPYQRAMMPPNAQQQSLQQREATQAEQQWLRRIPDDPGGLLRRKFQYQYQNRQPSSSGGQAW